MTTEAGKGGMLKAAAVLFGAIIGAGIFGLPYVISKAGYPVGFFWMITLAGAVALTHVLFGEVVSVTPGEHRLVGYCHIYLGKWAKWVETVASVLSTYGGALAYLILGGLFISQILRLLVPISPMAGSSLLFLMGVWAIWRGTKFLAGVDFWLTLGEGLSFLLLSVYALTAFEPANLAVSGPWTEALQPYGVILFAYGGISAVTEVRRLAGSRRDLRRGLALGSLAASGLTILFVTAVVGALGSSTSVEAVAGLNAKFGGPIPLLGGIAGFLAVATSYVVFASYLKNQFQYDFKWRSWLAGFAAVGVPFLLFLAGVKNFGKIIELVGGALVGVEGVLVSLLYLKARKVHPGKMLAVPTPLVYLLTAIYAGGAIYELVFRLF